jgi:protein-arginine kinase activator protein McsA
MTQLQKKWIGEGYDAIDTIKNAFDALRAAKKDAAANSNYEQAALARDTERAFHNAVLNLFEIDIKVK